jgi:hypothetical protein
VILSPQSLEAMGWFFVGFLVAVVIAYMVDRHER